MKYIAAILLLCSLASGADPSTGPVFGIWHIDGHGYQWQMDQINAGLPMEPCIKMQARGGLNRVDSVDANAEYLRQFDGKSIVLRMNNVTGEMDQKEWNPRIPNEEFPARLSESHLCVRVHPDTGLLDDTPTPSPWGAIEPWRRAGRMWGESVWMVRLQEVLPNPTKIVFLENNEGPMLDYRRLYEYVQPGVVNNNGVIVWAGKNNTPDQFVDKYGQPFGDDWKWVFNVNQWTGYRWRSDDELDAYDIRAKDWVGPRRDGWPLDYEEEYIALYQERYAALYEAFDAALSDGWRGKIVTAGYGWDRYHDAGSTQNYTGYYSPPQLTAPFYAEKLDEWRQRWANGPNNAFAEMSIRLRGTALFTDAVNGTGDVVDSESYAGFMSHYAWAMQAPGREVRVRWWERYITPPTEKIAASETWVSILESLGRPDVAELTVGDCEVAILKSFAEIHDHPTLRRYWQQGTTTILDSPQNEESVHRVWATETAIEGDTRTLLHFYTPCSAEQAPELNAGEYQAPWSRSSYWLTNPLEPLPPPVVRPQTLDEAVDLLLELKSRVEFLEQR